MGPDAWPINLGSWCMTHHHWVLTHDQNWVQTQDPLVLGPPQDPRELGPNTVLKRFGFGDRTQAKWVLTQDPLTLGLGAWPITLGSWRRTQIGSGLKTYYSGVLHRTRENWVLTPDPLALSLDAGPKRIGYGPSAFGSPNLLDHVVQLHPKLLWVLPPTCPNSNGSWILLGQDPTHNLFIYLIILIIQNYWIKKSEGNKTLIKLWISYTNVIKLKFLLLPKIILYYNIYKLFFNGFYC